jgi:hypothetical protein
MRLKPRKPVLIRAAIRLVGFLAQSAVEAANIYGFIGFD